MTGEERAGREEFDPTDTRSWLSRGRSIEHANELARIWTEFPDLPVTAPLADRMARGRQRIAAMRPLNEVIAAAAENERQHRNFSFVEAKARNGNVTDRDLAILQGRDRYDYDWNSAVAYASGWWAADTGAAYNPYACHPSREQAKRAAYDQGFSDGGGDPADLFDAARRSNLAAMRRDNQREPAIPPASGRLLPSQWPKPRDSGRPTRWPRRLLIVSDATIEEVTPGQMRVTGLRVMEEIGARPGADAMTVITIDRDAGFVAGGCSVERETPIGGEQADEIIKDRSQSARLRGILAGREIDDILIAVQGDYLRIIDAFADALPICTNMERTRNSLLQQRAHLRCWLDRGHDGAGNLGAGHIRWGKIIKGLTGKLGEFTARHVGRAPERGYLIRIEIAGGEPAAGYTTSSGELLAPEITVSNKAHIRREMAAALRAFGGATRLGAGSRYRRSWHEGTAQGSEGSGDRAAAGPVGVSTQPGDTS